jgi:hypothetical protein
LESLEGCRGWNALAPIRRYRQSWKADNPGVPKGMNDGLLSVWAGLLGTKVWKTRAAVCSEGPLASPTRVTLLTGVLPRFSDLPNPRNGMGQLPGVESNPPLLSATLVAET